MQITFHINKKESHFDQEDQLTWKYMSCTYIELNESRWQLDSPTTHLSRPLWYHALNPMTNPDPHYSSGYAGRFAIVRRTGRDTAEVNEFRSPVGGNENRHHHLRFALSSCRCYQRDEMRKFRRATQLSRILLWPNPLWSNTIRA
ncbi:hypothetical protein YC2023_085718 [Brassica napus]